MDIAQLIEELQEAQIGNPTLELQDILRIFHIKVTQELTSEIRRLANG